MARIAPRRSKRDGNTPRRVGPIAAYRSYLSRSDFLKAAAVFVCVSDEGSMTAAANVLGLTQSAVSQHIKQLENEFAQRLFDRSERPLRLTRAGLVLRKMAVDLISQAARIQSIVRTVGDDSIQQLRIAVIGSLAGTLVPAVVADLINQFKVRDVSVRRGLATSNDNALVRREADLLITSDPLLDIPQLERHALYSEPFILLTPNDPVLKSMTLPALAKALPFIRYSREFITGRVIETHLHRLRVEPEHLLEFDSSLDIVAMVAYRSGWSITTPSSAVHGMATVYSAPRNKQIHIAPLPGPGFRRTIYLIVRTNELGELPPKIAEMCREVIRNELLPHIYKLGPWLRREIIVGDATPQPGYA